MARSLADIKKSHGPRDYAAEFRAGLKTIPAGQYESSAELCNRIGLSTKIIPSIEAQFEAHAVAVKNAGGKPAWMWARTPVDAKKLRGALKSQNG